MSTGQRGRAVTIDDVAARAGVSRSAVSKVIRGAYGVSAAMMDRVTTAIEDLEYRPRVSARGMRGSTYTFGLEIPDVFNQFFPKLIDGAMAQLAKDGSYQLVVAPADLNHIEVTRAIQALADRQVDGLVAITPMVVLLPARIGLGTSPRRSARRASSGRLPSSLRAPAIT